ncbi:MAG: hypothetical protein RL156_1732 [Bacteroidota bacterium]|jgi:antirestriction protein
METPSVYVGTYAKYNSGSIKGAWINLEDYAGDREGFYAACAELHSDEADPEFMFQDFQCFPREFYSESGLPEELFEWLELDDYDRELLEKYAEATGYDITELTIENAREAFWGRFDSGADAAQQIAEESGAVPKDLPCWIVIDWQDSWDSNLRHDYCTAGRHGDLWIFSNR